MALYSFVIDILMLMLKKCLMKFKIVFILSIVFPFLVNAQTELAPQIPVDEEGNIRYTEVFQQEGDA